MWQLENFKLNMRLIFVAHIIFLLKDAVLTMPFCGGTEIKASPSV